MVALVGIVNITEDSFSDGGRFLNLPAAIAQGEKLLAQGADWLDLGAESSNPEGQKVSAEEEIRRLTPVIRHFKAQGAKLAVDTYKAPVMQVVLDLGVDQINDITALRSPEATKILATTDVPVVIMFARNSGPRAQKKIQPYHDLIPEITAFFQERLTSLATQGIPRERVILDPGMGFFLGSNPEPSLWVLKHLRLLHGLGQPLYLCTSRKSFIGHVLDQPIAERGIGTLLTEFWAIQQGVHYLRTHDIAPLIQARKLWQALEGIG